MKMSNFGFKKTIKFPKVILNWADFIGQLGRWTGLELIQHNTVFKA